MSTAARQPTDFDRLAGAWLFLSALVNLTIPGYGGALASLRARLAGPAGRIGGR